MQRYPGWERRVEARREPKAPPAAKAEWWTRLQPWLAIVTAIIAIATPAFYAAGQQLDETFLRAFAVPAGLFPRSTQNYISMGVLAYADSMTSLATSIWETLCVAYPILVLGALGFNLIRYLDDEKNPPPKLSPKWRRHLEVRKWIGFWGDTLVQKPALAYSYMLLTLLLVALIIVLPLYMGGEVGKKLGEKNIAKRVNLCADLSGPLSPSCMEVSKGGKIVARGAMVASSEKFIAIYANGETTILENKDLTLRAMVPRR